MFKSLSFVPILLTATWLDLTDLRCPKHASRKADLCRLSFEKGLLGLIELLAREYSLRLDSWHTS